MSALVLKGRSRKDITCNCAHREVCAEVGVQRLLGVYGYMVWLPPTLIFHTEGGLVLCPGLCNDQMHQGIPMLPPHQRTHL